jgi:hypothetical protein
VYFPGFSTTIRTNPVGAEMGYGLRQTAQEWELARIGAGH